MKHPSPLPIIALVLGVLALFCFWVWLEHRHPCVKYENDICMECSVSVIDASSLVPVCVVWDSVSCRVCVERAP